MGLTENKLDSTERSFAPVGLYEDLVFWEINYQTWTGEIDDATSLANYAYLVWQRHTMPIWGLKDPQAVHCFETFAPLFPNMRLIISERDKEQCIESFMKAFGGGEYLLNLCPDELSEEQYIRHLIKERLGIIERIKQSNRWPHLSIQYDNLLENPIGWVSLMAQFAFSGLDYFPPPENILAAVQHIDPELRTIG